MEDKQKIDLQLGKFWQQNIIEKAIHETDEYVSHIFTRPKKDGSLRIILNLSKLNEFVAYEHFKMENLSLALSLVQQNCFMSVIDLKDAYFSVSVHSEFRKYLRFYWNSELFQFTCMPNGLSSAPRIFTKLLKPIFSSLRSNGYCSVYYLDDSLLIGDTIDECQENVNATASMLIDAGFTINVKKSSLVHSQTIKFLGFVLDSKSMTIKLTAERINKVIELGKSLLNRRNIVIRELAAYIGTLVSTFPAVTYGPLFYRYLENDKTQSLKKSCGNFEGAAYLSEESRKEIMWWTDNIENSEKDIKEPLDWDTFIGTDASLEGWGAVSNSHKIGGRWNDIERGCHINVLELLAILLALKALFKLDLVKHVRVRTDSMTAVCYLNNMGGSKSLKCHQVVEDIWLYAVSRGFIVSAEHLPGIDNTLADKESRVFHDDTEWTLKNNILIILWKSMGNQKLIFLHLD